VLIADALRRGDQQHAPELTVRGTDGRVHLDVHGHATARHTESTQPVARSLALRLARGLIEAMTGTVTLEGGTEAEDYTVVIDLPAARISAGG
jgi:hypothetical protein